MTVPYGQRAFSIDVQEDTPPKTVLGADSSDLVSVPIPTQTLWISQL